MKSEEEYTKDLTEIRSMMERSTKSLSLTGWSGIMAGIYALAGAFIAYKFMGVDRIAASYQTENDNLIGNALSNLFLLAALILILAIGTAIVLSYRKSVKAGEKFWNPATRRLIANMAIPLATGGLFILILLSKGLFGLILPLMLIFYGLALLIASRFTYEEMRSLGIIEIVLGLIATCFTAYALLFWAIGFGIMHIAYGIYLHWRYEKK